MFTASATGGSGTYHYQWKRGTTNVGTDSATLSLANPVTLSQAGAYTVVVTDTAATPQQATSNSVTLTVTAAPTITAQPASSNTVIGNTAALSAATTGGQGTKTYQWQVQTGGSGAWANVTGGTGATTLNYVTPAVTTAMNGNKYKIIVTDANGVKVESDANATLSVLTPVLTVVAAAPSPAIGSSAGGTIPYAQLFTFGPAGQTYSNYNFSGSPTVVFNATGAVVPSGGQIPAGDLVITATHKSAPTVTGSKTVVIGA